jgi:hypothetical protein
MQAIVSSSNTKSNTKSKKKRAFNAQDFLDSAGVETRNPYMSCFCLWKIPERRSWDPPVRSE